MNPSDITVGMRFICVNCSTDWLGITGKVIHVGSGGKVLAVLDSSPRDLAGWYPEWTVEVEPERIDKIDPNNQKDFCPCGVWKYDCRYHRP